MSDTKKKIYLGEDLVCQTFTDAEEQAKAFDLFGLEQPVVSSNAPASTRPVQQGQVCELDGVNDYVDYGNNPVVSHDTPWEVEILFSQSAGGTYRFFYSEGRSSTTTPQFIIGTGAAASELFIAWRSNDNTNILQETYPSTIGPTNTWRRVRVSFDGLYTVSIHFADSGEDISLLDTVTVVPKATTLNKVTLGALGKTTYASHAAGNYSTLHTKSDGDTVILSHLNHASGTTAYDSSGNGNDGTLQNGAAFVVDNTLPPEADKLNLEGYTDDSGVLKPRDESDPANDIDGNPLQYSGSVYPRRPEYRNSYAASFDGVDDYAELPEQVLSHNQAWSIEVDFKFLATPTYRALYSEGNSATGTPHIYLGITGTHSQLDLYWRSDNNTVVMSEALFSVVSGNRHTVKVAFDGVDEVTVTKDGVIINTFTVTPLVTTVDRATIGANGRTSVGAFANAQISHVKTTQNGSTVGEYTLAEGAGDTAHDISGNDNHGTINNASTATEGAGFWAGRIDGEENALNNNNGFSKRMLFDGVDDYVNLGNSADFDFTNNIDITLHALIDDNTNSHEFVGKGTGTTTNWNIDYNSGIRFFGYESTVLKGITASAPTLTNNTKAKIRCTFNGTTWKIYVDDVEVRSVTDACTLTTNSNNVLVGERGSVSLSGTMYDISINGVATYTGNGNTDADWTDQIGSNDGTVNGSPALLRIPADTSDPTKDVYGDTLTNPAITDGYNGAETELDAYNIAEGDNPSPATNNNPDLESIEFGADFASNDAAYMRLKSSTENDRLITFEDDLTGGDETLAQKYTQ